MQDILNTNLEFPIIIIGSNNNIEICRDISFLTITSSLGYKKSVQLNNILVDSIGNYYKTIKVEKIKRLSPSWKFWLTNPMFETRLFVTQEPKETLDFFKNEVIRLITKNSEFWVHTIDLETLIERIKESQTYKEVIHHLSENA